MTVSIKSPTSTTGSIQLNGSDVLTIDSSGNLTVPNNLSVTGTVPIPDSLSTASGSAPSYSARAWVNFNGTGTVAIRDSGNVSSITDAGIGLYVVNFAANMPNDNYATAISVKQELAGLDGMARLSSDYNSSAVRVLCLQNTANTAIDCHTVTVMCIG